jgi:hypothetical protein
MKKTKQVERTFKDAAERALTEQVEEMLNSSFALFTDRRPHKRRARRRAPAKPRSPTAKRDPRQLELPF